MKSLITIPLISKRLVIVCLSIAFLSDAHATAPPYNRKELLSQLVRLNDEYIPETLKKQLTVKGKEYYGAYFDGDSLVSPIGTAGFIQTLMCSYVSRDSKYFQSKEILERMTLAANALVNLQHEDGTIDLLSTNFHSTPDLGFTIFPIGLAYSIMLKNNNLDFGKFASPMKQYLLRAGDALSVGGIHTPNHRWVVSAALAWVNSHFPNQKYKSRVDQWLAEKIDIDPDGQYNERSTAVYTPITNRCLLDIAKKMKYDYLYDVVRKNLNLTFYFVHSNGEIATESSNRQDQYLRRNMSGYYLAYNYMALLDNDSRYSGMVDYIQKSVPVDHLHYMLPQFIDDPTLLRDLPEPMPISTSYHQQFQYSDMVRVRDGAVDMSVITNNPIFFTYFKGEAALEAMRLSSAFFGKGQFESEELEKVGDTYILSSTIYGPYYQPLPKEKIPDDMDAWTKVPRTERTQSEVQTLRTKVYVTPGNGKATIKISVDGPKNLPVTLELGFRTGGTLQNVISKQGVDGAFLIKNGEYATYQLGKDSIRIGSGVRAHNWIQLRGALPKLQADCLYFTNYAPCEFEFTIE
ncbi:MAG TPA: hypothetical protein VK625_15260 [Flavitalea sp.]|nr:hypothetical protein [Flavitalea sp.]